MIILHLILHSSVHIYDFHIFITSEMIYLKFAPCMGIRILESGKFFLVESRIQHIFAAESGLLGLGIRNTAQWNPESLYRLESNPSTTDKESGIQYFESVIQDSLTGDEKSNIHRRGVSLSLACKQTLFYFSFRSFQKHRQAREQIERARKKNKVRLFLFSSSPTTTPLCWRSIKPLQVTFYHVRSTDFEEKIEGL